MRVLAIRKTKESPPDKPLRGYADVDLGNGITVKEFRIWQEPGKRAWVTGPQHNWKDRATGQLKHTTLVTFPDEMMGEIERLVLNSFSQAKGENTNESKTNG